MVPFAVIETKEVGGWGIKFLYKIAVFYLNYAQIRFASAAAFVAA